MLISEVDTFLLDTQVGTSLVSHWQVSILFLPFNYVVFHLMSYYS
jgi:hypothetical protein